MRFRDLIDAPSILLQIEDTDKEAAIQSLVAHVATARSLDASLIAHDVLERERSLSTGVGQGVAVPHALVEGLKAPMVGFGRHSTGLDFEAIDGQDVHLIFLLLSPAEDIPLHLKLLSRVSRLCQKVSFRSALYTAEQPDHVLMAIQDAERALTDL